MNIAFLSVVTGTCITKNFDIKYVSQNELWKSFKKLDDSKYFLTFRWKNAPTGIRTRYFQTRVYLAMAIKRKFSNRWLHLNLNLWFTNEPLQAFRTHFLSAPFVAASISLDLKSYFKVSKTKLFVWSWCCDRDFDEMIFYWTSRWTPTWRCWSRATRNNCRQQRAT